MSFKVMQMEEKSYGQMIQNCSTKMVDSDMYKDSSSHLMTMTRK